MEFLCRLRFAFLIHLHSLLVLGLAESIIFLVQSWLTVRIGHGIAGAQQLRQLIVAVCDSQDEKPASTILIRMPLQLFKACCKRLDTAPTDCLFEGRQELILLFGLQHQRPRKRYVQWKCDTKIILQQAADVIVGTLPSRSRFVLWIDELRKDLSLLWRRTPSAASAIAVRARRRGIQRLANTPEREGSLTFEIDMRGPISRYMRRYPFATAVQRWIVLRAGAHSGRV